jgi:hypothetical protein
MTQSSAVPVIEMLSSQDPVDSPESLASELKAASVVGGKVERGAHGIEV